MFAALMLVLLAGGMNGSFAVPMKRIRAWQWEHTWLAWSIVAMFFIPLAVAVVTIPNLLTVYQAAGPEPLVRTALYGMIWGAGTVLFGLGIARVGLALSFGIVLGTSSLLGTILPMMILHSNQLISTAGLLMLTGVIVIVAGVAACAWAGFTREPAATSHTSQSSFSAGFFICLLSGIGSSFMSLALNESAPISRAAERLGTLPDQALNAVWPVLLAGGFTVNALYCACLLVFRGNTANFGKATLANLRLVVMMAILWAGSNFVYAAGARKMGQFGLVLGWPVFMAAIVLTANAWGLLTGEWRNAQQRAMASAAAGCLMLVAGIWIIGLAGGQLK